MVNFFFSMISDFGLSEFYIEGGQHVREEPEEIDGAAAGTLRYISIYAHRHKVISRRDDIESIGYVLIYMLRGNVAWASRTGDVKNGKSERIRKIKTETSLVVCTKPFRFCMKYMTKTISTI